MRIALAQINPTVGDLVGNLALHQRAVEQARAAGAELVVFPELSIIGYPPKDLLLKPAAIEQAQAAVQQLATCCQGIAALVGYPAPAEGARGLALYNAAALLRDGRQVQRFIKSLLPTYDVFDERRYFEPGYRVPGALEVGAVNGAVIGVSICEDLWTDEIALPRQLYHDDPITRLVQSGAEIIVNCSASPFVLGKHELRLQLLANTARKHQRPVLYCNQVGGNDELVFDGHSCALDAHGKLIAHACGFAEDLLLVDLAHPADNRTEQPLVSLRSAYEALVLGLRDYMRKCGFKSIVLGLSGGIDSALTCALAVAAVGKENVRGVSMPSRFSSEHSRDDAADLAHRLGIAYHSIPIGAAHETMEQMLAPSFAGLAPDITEENLQARLRGVLLMAFSNKFGSLLVTTGNKSELAVGYCTLYGDMCGGLAVLSDVPKTLVWELSRWINDAADSPLRRLYGGPVIPQSSIDKIPSAELRPNQTDQDSLPPYPVLDEIVERYVEQEQPARQIIAETGYDPELVLRFVKLIDRNEYKRKQAAPGLKITGRAFGFGRRMPIAQRFDNAAIL